MRDGGAGCYGSAAAIGSAGHARRREERAPPSVRPSDRLLAENSHVCRRMDVSYLLPSAARPQRETSERHVLAKSDRIGLARPLSSARLSSVQYIPLPRAKPPAPPSAETVCMYVRRVPQSPPPPAGFG